MRFTPVPPGSVLRVSHVLAKTGPGTTASEVGDAAAEPPTLLATTLNV